MNHHKLLISLMGGTVLRNIDPPPSDETKGLSLIFGTTSNSRLVFDHDPGGPSTNLNLHGSDWTMEWYQYMQPNPKPLWPRIWSFGGMDFSIEDTGTYLFSSTTAEMSAYIKTYWYNRWVHVALSYIDGDLTVFFNGTSIDVFENFTIPNATSVGKFVIGNYSDSSNPENAFPGYLAQFRLVKGIGLYTVNFTVPSSPLIKLEDEGIETLLLITSPDFTDATKDFGTYERTGLGTDLYASGNNPFPAP